jgi:hypothetical protein
MADFTGFYFDNVHSSTYGLIRTSDGDRYKEGLIPEFEDREIELVGGDGSLYEGRRFKKTNFTIKVAFDNMTEQQLRELRIWLGTDELKPFRFDERPYKTYWVKPSRKPELSYICFMEKDDNDFLGHKRRIYKGEGEIEFTAYDPFGYCIDETTEIVDGQWVATKDGTNWQKRAAYRNLIVDKVDNLEEWGDIAGLWIEEDLEGINRFRTSSITRQGIADWGNYNSVSGMDAGLRERFISDSYNTIVYNPGDFDAEFQLVIPLSGSNISCTADDGVSSFIQIYIQRYINEVEKESFNAYSFRMETEGLKESDIVVLDTKKRAMIVYSYQGKSTDTQKPGSVYVKTLRYDLISSTDFPKIPRGKSQIRVERGLNGFHLRLDSRDHPVYKFIDNNGEYTGLKDGNGNTVTDVDIKGVVNWEYYSKDPQNPTKCESAATNRNYFNPVYLYDFKIKKSCPKGTDILYDTKNEEIIGDPDTERALVEFLDTGEHIIKNSNTALVRGGMQTPHIKYNYKYY